MPRLKVLGLGRLRRPAPRHDNSGYDKRDQDYSPTLALRRRDEFLATHPNLLFVSIGCMAGHSEFNGLRPILPKAKLAAGVVSRDLARRAHRLERPRTPDHAEPNDVASWYGGHESAARCTCQKRL